MAQSSVCCSPCQNLHNGKDKLAGKTPTKGSNRCTPAPATTHAPTTAIIPFAALVAAFGSADSSVVKYLEDDLQRIIRTILEARPLLLPAPAPIPAPVLTPAPHYESTYKRTLKAWFADIYWGKTHLKCYNFF